MEVAHPGSADAPRRPRRRAESRKTRKAAVAIAQRIVDDITEEKLSPGAKLAGERDMLLRFDAGRGTLRESLRFLEMNGVITLKAGPSGGPIVAAPDGHDLAGVLGLFLQMRQLPFKALISAREILEPELAASAAESGDGVRQAEITDSIEGMRAFLDDEQNFLAENDRFHAAVAAASENDLFALLITSLHTITDGMPLGVSYPPARRDAVLRAHEAVHDAIVGRDPEGARWAMRRHIREFHRYVEERFPAVYERPVRWRDIAP
ncbi:FadR/GntR family transcriptional regulator [Pseudonocardia sp.]|uniref:FadR/GntR family transcriptional regulator n=1 Tax=Pseudonocardia sp. TaxID=60912 RepID=UPI003D103669